MDRIIYLVTIDNKDNDLEIYCFTNLDAAQEFASYEAKRLDFDNIDFKNHFVQSKDDSIFIDISSKVLNETNFLNDVKE